MSVRTPKPPSSQSSQLRNTGSATTPGLERAASARPSMAWGTSATLSDTAQLSTAPARWYPYADNLRPSLLVRDRYATAFGLVEQGGARFGAERRGSSRWTRARTPRRRLLQPRRCARLRGRALRPRWAGGHRWSW